MKGFDRIMKSLSNFVVKFRMPIAGMFLALAVLGVFGLFLTKINSDVLSYLPPDSATSEGMTFLGEHFGLSSNALVALDKDTDYQVIGEYVTQIGEIEGVTNVFWIGSLDDMTVGDISLGDLPATREMLEGIRAKAAEILTRDGNYLLMITMNIGASTDEAGDAIKEIRTILGDAKYALGGTAPVSRQVFDDAISELPIYLAIAVVLVLIVLFLTAHSWIEPLIFITTMGVAILINMGSNIMFGEISIITFCAAAIFQLGMAMDYSIFLMHMYTEERASGMDSHAATKSALKRTLPTVAASGLTTMGGMGALFMMSFTIGADLGGVLLKGIAISLITVIFLQPCLLILFDKIVARSKKKAIDFKFQGLAKFTIKNRIAVLIIFILLLVPAYLGQHFLELSYLDFLPEPEVQNELTDYVEDLSNQLFVAVPLDPDNLLLQKEYLTRLADSQNVSAVTGLLSMLPDDMIGEDGRYYIETGIAFLDPLDITDALIATGESMGFIHNGYALYTISLNQSIEIESAQATEAVEEIGIICAGSFNDYVVTGIAQGVKDFQEITPNDFFKINLLSIALVLLVLIFNQRSFKYPMLLLLLIQFGIWFNFSIDRILGASVNFLSYLVVGSIQLGATVDYAILLTDKYKHFRKEGADPLRAAYTASSSASMSILTSASIMFVACVSVSFIASNAVVKEIAGLISRGAVISCVLVLCVLPSMLASSERFDIFVKASGGVKGLSERFLKELNEQAKKSAEKLKEGAEKLKESAEKIIENAKHLQEQVLKGGKKKLHKNSELGEIASATGESESKQGEKADAVDSGEAEGVEAEAEKPSKDKTEKYGM